ncbi:MAG: NlpC/P60 family protein [Bacteroidota bacterium]|nr:NlpC/P60 family protein [Bacteroidota bacterium]
MQRISARDTSTKNNTTASKQRGNVQFLDDITISNGGRSGQINESQKVHSAGSNKSISKVTYAPPTDVLPNNYNIESATGLQFKYAILLGASVERLQNISLLQDIEHWWGTRYCMGGSTESCIDCSAFTQIVLHDVYKTEIPRTARAQYDKSSRIELPELKEGDLLFFQTVGIDISHVGVYLTNNKFVHAATSGGVMISDLNDNYWSSRYKGAGRVISSEPMASNQ